jgi:GAF domain-containing protein
MTIHAKGLTPALLAAVGIAIGVYAVGMPVRAVLGTGVEDHIGMLALSVAVAVVVTFSLRDRTPRVIMWVTVGLIAASVLGWGMSLRLANRHLPLAELVVMLLVLALVALIEAAERGKTILTTLVEDVEPARSERVWPPPFSDVAGHWSLILTALGQLVDIDRAILLAPADDPQRVREVTALGCSVGDIEERRRDIRRSPYSTALESRDAVCVNDGPVPFLNGPGPKERQYLTAALRDGKPLGFLAVAVAEPKPEEEDRLRLLLVEFSDQIAALLDRRAAAEAARSHRRSRLEGLSTHDETELLAEVSASIDMIQTRVKRLDRLLDGYRNPVMLADLFGRVLELNGAMLRVLDNLGYSPYDSTVLELITLLGGVETSEGRSLLRVLVLEERSFSVPAPAISAVLEVRPVRCEPLGDSPPTPFDLGVMCEITPKGPPGNSHTAADCD